MTDRAEALKKRLGQLKAQWARWDKILFPVQTYEIRRMPIVGQIVFVAIVASVGALGARFFPYGKGIGFDWEIYFSHGRVDTFYPPWGSWVVAHLTWPWLVGLSLAGVSLAVLKRAVHPVSAACALLALPVLWTIFLGQLEGLITLGMCFLPWLAPLALLKPQVSTFAFGARASYIVAFFVWIVISLAIYGPWPLVTLRVNQIIGEGRLVTDISLFGWGWLIAPFLFWASRGDMDLLMYSGTVVTPYLLPYNMLPATAAIARLRPRAAVVACVFSWLPFAANWVGPRGWWLFWLFIIFMWLCLAAARYRKIAPRSVWRRIFVAPEPAPAQGS